MPMEEIAINIAILIGFIFIDIGIIKGLKVPLANIFIGFLTGIASVFVRDIGSAYPWLNLMVMLTGIFTLYLGIKQVS